MRGMIIFILLIVGFFAVVTGTEVVQGGGMTLAFPPTAGSGGQPVNGFTPIVDRDDDPEISGEVCSDAPGDCSLRAAILMAKEQPGNTTITFADHFLINVTRPLPTLTHNNLSIVAPPGQEIRINGGGLPSPVFHITGSKIRLEGLRIYGAGPGSQTILVNGPARQVTIVRNIIGDDDGPEGNCNAASQSIAGIYLQPAAEEGAGVRAWIYGNIIECHLGYPGDGIVIKSDAVIVGADENGQAGPAQQNHIRRNNGIAIRLDGYGGNTIRNNQIHDNAAGAISMTNFANNLMDNNIY